MQQFFKIKIIKKRKKSLNRFICIEFTLLYMISVSNKIHSEKRKRVFIRHELFFFLFKSCMPKDLLGREGEWTEVEFFSAKKYTHNDK
jgi:hypothetical protein